MHPPVTTCAWAHGDVGISTDRRWRTDRRGRWRGFRPDASLSDGPMMLWNAAEEAWCRWLTVGRASREPWQGGALHVLDLSRAPRRGDPLRAPRKKRRAPMGTPR
jgi:hypothetical protein